MLYVCVICFNIIIISFYFDFCKEIKAQRVSVTIAVQAGIEVTCYRKVTVVPLTHNWGVYVTKIIYILFNV